MGHSGMTSQYRLLGLFAALLTFPAQQASAFSVVKTDTPRSMENLVLGTVALPFVPGDPMQLLDDAFARGFCRFDLARTYGAGKSEKVFGRWLAESGVEREKIKLVTKGGMGNDKYGDPNRELCTRESLRGELSASLKALQTDYADLYMLHRDDPRIEASDFVDWMNELKTDGMIKKWGVSNWCLNRIHEANDYAAANGLEPLTATSPQLSLAVPSTDVWPSTYSLSCPSKASEINWYRDNGIEVMGWEALAKGFMAVPTFWRRHEVDYSTFHGPDGEVGTDLWRTQRIQRAYCTPANYARREIALKLAKDSGLTLAQIALLYSLAKGDHVSVLVGADRTSHLNEMAEIRDYALDQEAVDCLTAASMKSSVVSRVALEVKAWEVDSQSLVFKKLGTNESAATDNGTSTASSDSLLRPGLQTA